MVTTYDALSCGFLDTTDGHRRIMTRIGAFNCPPVGWPVGSWVIGTQPPFIPALGAPNGDPNMGEWAGRHNDAALDGGASYGFMALPAKSGNAGYDPSWAGKVLLVGGVAPGGSDDNKLCYIFDPGAMTKWLQFPYLTTHARPSPPFLIFAGNNGVQTIGGGSDVIEQLVYDIDGVTLIWKDVATITGFGNAIAVCPTNDGNDSFFVLTVGSTTAQVYLPSIGAIGYFGTIDLSGHVTGIDYVSLATRPYMSTKADCIFASIGTITGGGIVWKLLQIENPQDSRYATITEIASTPPIVGINQFRPIAIINYFVLYTMQNPDTGRWFSRLYNTVTDTYETTEYPLPATVQTVALMGRIKDPIDHTDLVYFFGKKADTSDSYNVFTVASHTVIPPET